MRITVELAAQIERYKTAKREYARLKHNARSGRAAQKRRRLLKSIS